MENKNKSESESDVEKYFIWTVASMGGKTFKFKSINHRGVADQVACLPDGSTWFVELKALNGRLSELQKVFAKEMRLLNQNYRLFNSTKEINEWKETWKLHKTK
jgi:hypothetical protein